VSPSDKPVYRFVFLRHAESVGNVESRWQGQSNYPLTEKGRAQARALADRWNKEDVKFDLVITSTLARAQETAEIATSYLEGVKIESAELSMQAKNTIEVDLPRARANLRLIENLEDHDDVQRVTANFEIPDEMLAEAASA